MRSIEIVVPMCPDAALNPNSRPHYRTKAKHVKELRSAARLAAVHARNTCGGGAMFHGAIHVYPLIAWGKRRKSVDGDNALSMLKSCFDGFTDAFIWDDDRHVIHHPVVQGRDPDGLGYVRVTVKEANHD